MSSKAHQPDLSLPVRPVRILWMTDTFGDHNGVSTVLSTMHQHIKRHDLPVDIMICSNTVQPDDHLLVVRPVSEFAIPGYRQQPFRIPNYRSVYRAFRKGCYEVIICSTEGPMSVAAIWLKNVFSPKTFFYLHTDWLVFAQEVVGLERLGLNILQKALRFYYNRYDSIFVLNTDQRSWLTTKGMGFDPARVFLTAHWADPIFSDSQDDRATTFPFDPGLPVVLYAGRISKEKGVMELPRFTAMIRSVLPEVQVVIAGTGPAEGELKAALPDACYLGWVVRDNLPSLYRSADILVLPSRFDTFSCVVLESLNCGLPVVAYNTKGPKDIIGDGISGYLVDTTEAMASKVISFLMDPDTAGKMKKAARARAAEYHSETIMNRLLSDTGIFPERATA